MKLTLAQVNILDGYKPLCVDCHGPCHPKSREYRGLQLCPSCYLDRPLNVLTQKKELICPKN